MKEESYFGKLSGMTERLKTAFCLLSSGDDVMIKLEERHYHGAAPKQLVTNLLGIKLFTRLLSQGVLEPNQGQGQHEKRNFDSGYA